MNRHSIVKTQGVHQTTYNYLKYDNLDLNLILFHDMVDLNLILFHAKFKVNCFKAQLKVSNVQAFL